MDMSGFITVGENIHCTRIVQSKGGRTDSMPDGSEALAFRFNGERYLLPIPPNWAEISPPYADGKIRHVALAINQALTAESDEVRSLGEKYLQWAAERQIKKGAAFLDVNVDEYTNDTAKRVEVMAWIATFLSGQYDTPLSIDSSNTKTLEAGLSSCAKGRAPMVNSVSLEREDAVDIVIQYGADAIVSPAGKSGLPNSAEERKKNFDAIIALLSDKGMAAKKMHLDPLVFPISVDPMNGKNFFDATTTAKQTYDGVNITGGLSNISFGMPNRKLLNMVFTWMFVDAGGNGGIIDPMQMPPEEVAKLDAESEPFLLAKAVLDGTDMYGTEYIAAFREGKLS